MSGMKLFGIPVAIAVLLMAGLPARAESVAGLVQEGNRLYREGQLAAALEKYRRAQTLSPASAGVQYNIGNVLYKQGEYEKAFDAYRQAFSSSDRTLAEGARYNAGNTHFARKNWPEAIRNYQEALRLDANDVDAKRNLELALLQMQEEQKKQQQQQQQQDDQDQDQDQQDKNQPQPKEQKGSPKDSPRPEPREQNTPGEEKQRISREEAMRILDAMKDQDRPPKDQIKAPPPDKKPEKDW